MFFFWSNYYFLFLIVWLFCLVHAIRTGRREWIFILIIFPGISALAYFIVELLPDIRRGTFASGFQLTFFPKARIRDREKRVKLSDSVTNRLALADAYAEQGRFEDAISLVQSCMTDMYASDQDLMLRLARLYFQAGRYTDSVALFSRALHPENSGMNRMEDEVMYTRAMEGTGNKQVAEEMYQKVIRRHHSLEARYWYGQLLKQEGRAQEAREQFKAIREDMELQPRYVRRLYAPWARKAGRELRSF
ncbi:tetratricopeptide repeat protein [Dinghuibacter silviterrae]|uniref:Uncharacterized protein n=1 Tax=Dinghuibacter silviterrae TaxID=1539049 RepID=A0A4R8DNI9_9BACT|nr:tetratricopeptide repeat protein [Dinghuibacter silviterrae]TDW99267.1 hypothetical protein EDB95_0276 [Dinghuibacter silviterrae]